ncbi:hypothetical protein [Thermus sp.]|uniref:hypothetical protein n=1 Tax=Thermus sp. TaxID=275 RepID=UPI0039A5100A
MRRVHWRAYAKTGRRYPGGDRPGAKPLPLFLDDSESMGLHGRGPCGGGGGPPPPHRPPGGPPGPAGAGPAREDPPGGVSWSSSRTAGPPARAQVLPRRVVLVQILSPGS